MWEFSAGISHPSQFELILVVDEMMEKTPVLSFRTSGVCVQGTVIL